MGERLLESLGLPCEVLGAAAGEPTAADTREAARKLESDLRDAGKRASFQIVEGVDHAFFNDTRPDVYDAEAAARAWADTLAFLRAELS